MSYVIVIVIVRYVVMLTVMVRKVYFVIVAVS